MSKRMTFALSLALAAVAFSSATLPGTQASAQEQAAPAKAPALSGTVASTQGTRVEITVEGEKPAWVKKGAGIKLADIKGGLGKIVEVSATSVVFNTKKAGELKVGDKLTVEKGTVVPAGC